MDLLKDNFDDCSVLRGPLRQVLPPVQLHQQVTESRGGKSQRRRLVLPSLFPPSSILHERENHPLESPNLQVMEKRK